MGVKRQATPVIFYRTATGNLVCHECGVLILPNSFLKKQAWQQRNSADGTYAIDSSAIYTSAIDTRAIDASVGCRRIDNTLNRLTQKLPKALMVGELFKQRLRAGVEIEFEKQVMMTHGYPFYSGLMFPRQIRPR